MTRLTTIAVAGVLAGCLLVPSAVLGQAKPSTSPRPAISGIGPANGPTAGGIAITLTGSSFAAGAIVTVGGKPCPTTSVSATQIVCTLPAGQGMNTPVTVTVAGQSAISSYSYAAPTLTGIAPISGPGAGGGSLTVSGSNFGTAGTVMVGNSPCSPTSYSQTQVVCALPPGQGTQGVTITVAGQKSAAVNFAYLAAAPAITSLSPASAGAAGGVPLTVTGSGFGATGTVTVGGAACPTTSYGNSQIVCTLPPGQGAQSVVVTSSGQSSSPAGFTYVSPPSVSTLSPASGPAAGGTALTLSGANFGSNPSVTVGTLTCTVTSVTGTQIVCTTPAGQGAQPVVVTAGTQKSSGVTFTNTAPPTLSAVSPTSGPAAGGTAITLTGSNFGATGTVSVGSGACTPTSYGNTQIVCTVPAGQGTQAVSVTTGGQKSAAMSFAYVQAPTLSAINPTTAPLAGGVALTLSGASFGTSGTVSVGGAACAPTSWSDTQIVCTLPAGQSTQAVVVTAGDGQKSAAVNLTYAAPSLTALNPTTAGAGGGTTLTLDGANFGTSGSVTVGGKTCSNPVWGPAKISCTLPAGQGTGHAVTVTSGGATSNALTFGYAPPTLTNVSPTTAATEGGTSVAVTGENFGTSGSVTIGGVACPVTAWSNSQAVCTLPAGQGAAQVVVTAGGQQSTNSLAFTYAAPTITAVTPTSGSAAGGIALTLVGSSFGTSGTVTVGNASCPATSYSHTRIVCTLPAGQGQAGIVVTSGGRASAPYPFNY